MKKLLFLITVSLLISSYSISQVKVFFAGEKDRCAYVVHDGKIYESGSTKCTMRKALYTYTDNKAFFYDKQDECCLVLEGDKIYNGSMNKDQKGEVRFIIKGNELINPGTPNDSQFIIEDNKVWFGSDNKIDRKDNGPLLIIEGEIPPIALYLILSIIVR